MGFEAQDGGRRRLCVFSLTIVAGNELSRGNEESERRTNYATPRSLDLMDHMKVKLCEDNEFGAFVALCKRTRGRDWNELAEGLSDEVQWMA